MGESASLGPNEDWVESISWISGATPFTLIYSNENVPLSEEIQDCFEREVLPHVPDAWIDKARKDKEDGQVGIVGYEINFNRYFYQYQPPRPLEAIDADLKQVEAEIAELLQAVAS